MQRIELTNAAADIRLPPRTGNRVRLTGRIEGAQRQKDGAALVLLALSNPLSPEVLQAHGISVSPKFGPFVYIQARKEDADRFALEFLVPDDTILTGLSARLWNSGEPIILSEFEVARSIVNPVAVDEVLVNVSVDVEALPHRATEGHVDKLIFGRIGGGAFGIPREIGVFRDLGVPATFYLELGEVALWGLEPLREAGQRIRDSGMDLQLHLHSEVFARAQHWPWTQPVPPMLHNLDAGQTRRALSFAVEQYEKIAGSAPKAFRAGGYLFNAHTVEIASELGVQGFSNYRADQRPNNAYDFEGPAPMRPFRWRNGAFEFPVTLSPEPLSALSPDECWRRIMHHVRVNKTWVVNIVIHSWSLMHRDAEGHHAYRNADLENNLRRMIEIAPPGVRFASMSEIIDFSAKNLGLFDLVKDVSALQRRAA